MRKMMWKRKKDLRFKGHIIFMIYFHEYSNKTILSSGTDTTEKGCSFSGQRLKVEYRIVEV